MNISHCDIKPANILVNTIEIAGMNLFNDVKLCDFDFIVEGDISNSSHFGTRLYLPPEVKYDLGYSEISKIDVYSFGVTMIELLCGHDFIKSLQSNVSQLEETLQHNFPCLTSDMSKKLFEICVRCINQDPKERPPIKAIHEQLLELFVELPQFSPEDKYIIYTTSELVAHTLPNIQLIPRKIKTFETVPTITRTDEVLGFGVYKAWLNGIEVAEK
ncbi:predicted protein, partial [Naegleria gruberi]